MVELGFNKWELDESDGCSRGIWMGWRDQNVEIQVLQTKFQFIYVKINEDRSRDWFFIVIYANPANDKKERLRNDILTLASI